MKIEEEEDNGLKIKPTTQNIDNALGVPEPFINKPAVYCVCGAMGSGKSSWLNSIMTAGGKNQVFKHKFDYVFYATPKEVFESEENHPFAKHNPTRLFFDLSHKTFEKIIDTCQTAKEEEKSCCRIYKRFH